VPTLSSLDVNAFEADFYRLYRQFFDLAEKKRRWSLRDDIPWDQVNRSMDPAIADVVESFCAVEMYLPDYVENAMAMFRTSRARAWFYANWGYEESKHSLALGDWLLRSGLRTDEEMNDLESRVFQEQWTVPHDSAVGMLIYAMAQELATALNYRNLRRPVDEQGDAALSKVLALLRVDELAHHSFFLKAVRLYLQHDRQGTLEQMRRVLHSFQMPALHMLADSSQRVADIKSLQVYSEEIYMREVYLPIMDTLGVEWWELRRSRSRPKSA
jgi:acyl-[acyl-carrier-protein] desaturase